MTSPAPPPAASRAIDVKNLFSTIRVGFLNRPLDVLHDVSFSVAEHHVVGFVGENGAGKSTTIKTLIGALRPTRGEVRVCGGDPQHAAARRAFGYLPEFPRLPQTLTPREILRMHGVLAGLDTATLRQRSAALLDQVRMTHRADHRVGSFSKGMQQRIALALALVGDPAVLILDEPMSGLDPRGRRLVRDIITDYRAKGRTVFFSSHVLPDVEALCDEVVILHGGRVVTTGTLESIFAASGQNAEIRFRDANESVRVSAASHGALSQRGDMWVLHTTDPDPFAVATALHAAGARIVAVTPHASELADAIVALTDAQPNPAPDAGGHP